MAKSPPSPNGSNGRDPATGRFLPGWKGGSGNPHAKLVGKLRAAMLAAVDEAAIRRVVEALIKKAEGGNVPAVRELLDRCIGKPHETDLIERIERLEATLVEKVGR
ncbi:MAG: hypothetical protein IH988_05215 [Planctomycetes bacterium]|nr:hypothetical protein [Planctomycetota bacterium]